MRVSLFSFYFISYCIDNVCAAQVLDHCLTDASRKYVADDMALGVLHFFRALALSQLAQYDEASVDLQHCSTTHFMNSKHNKFLLHFANAKIHQCQKQHKEAVSEFSLALDLQPQNPYCHFRRAWSFKVCVLPVNKLFYLYCLLPSIFVNLTIQGSWRL